MKRQRFVSLRIILLLCLFLALPALACNTLAGDDEADSGAPDAQQAVQDGPDDVSDSGGEGAESGETSASGAADSGETSPPGEGDSGGSAAAGGPAGETGLSPDGDGENGEPPAGSSGDQGGDGPAGDTREALVGALSSSMEVDAMRITLASNVDGLESETVLEFVRPDRYHLTGQGIEFIIIGDNTYLKGDGSDWIQSPAGMGDSVQPLVDQMLAEAAISQDIDELVGSIDDVQFLGNETLNGVDTLIYEYSQVTPDGAIDQTSRVWIGASDGRIYRQEVSGVFGGQSIDTSIQYEYGSDIVIEPPL